MSITDWISISLILLIPAINYLRSNNKPYMKKLLILTTLALLSIPFLECRKDQSNAQSQTDTHLIQKARQFFTDSIISMSTSPSANSVNPRISGPKTPVWDSAKTITTAVGPAVLLPVRYSKSLHIRTNFTGQKLFDLNELTHLLIYQDPGRHYHAELVTVFPDSLALQPGRTQFSGILFVEDWAGNPIQQYKYNPDGTIFASGPSQTQAAKSIGLTPTSSNPIVPDIVMTTCYEIDGYNYSPDDPDDGFAWSEPAGCTSSYYPVTQSLVPITGPSASDYGSTPVGGNMTVVVGTAGTPIYDIQSYFKCFTNSPTIDYTYSVTLCISQPVPGTNTPWGFTNGGPAGSSSARNIVNVGHTFLIFRENSAGNIITRNIGFYPQAMVTPPYPSDQGQLEDNGQTGYNISVTFTITNTQFFSMLNYAEIGNNPGYLYNLNSNNCTTFALHTLAAGDIILSPSQGTWPGGSGYDPGDLGQYAISLPLPPNATRNTVAGPHPNTGTCN